MVEPLSVDEIRRLFAVADEDAARRLARRFAGDEREGVRALVARARKQAKHSRVEDRRLDTMAVWQEELHAAGHVIVAGVDEVGRGALAGPLTACAIILPVDVRIRGLDDSKAIIPPRRVELAQEISGVATAFSVAHIEPSDIDAMGMTAANRAVMRAAIAGLGVSVDHVLVDGIDDHLGMSCTAVIDGDAKVACIAAASIVAKVTRDALMVALDERYPGWGFGQHKGYSTPEHKRCIDQIGLSPIHRRSFSPCAQLELFDLD